MVDTKPKRFKKVLENADPRRDTACFSHNFCSCSYPLSSLSPFSYEQINNREELSLKSLIAYIAYHQQTSDDFVAAIFTTCFGIKEVKDLPRNQYQKAVECLVDLRIRAIIN